MVVLGRSFVRHRRALAGGRGDDAMSAKTIFITGASSGLGRAAVKLFASRGWKVIATMRTPDKEGALAKLRGIVLLALDTTNQQQIASVVAEAVSPDGVDVVFNNAG